ncbi:hypothetical protein [Actinomadura oligospora]|uniref:hypothetical protein n=1 Tax=Actinomadura oligospora TaxID=111804 RepID=UPI0012F8ABFC|nr:hypothetical protein [Actinomadura oligospora]
MSGNHRGGGDRGSRSGEYRSFSGQPRAGANRPLDDLPGGPGPADHAPRTGDSPARPGDTAARPGNYAGRAGEPGGRSGDYTGRPSEAAGRPGEYAGHSGEQAGGPGPYASRSGDYAGRSGDYAGRSGESADRSGNYASRSGEYGGRSGDYAGRSGEYRGRSGEYAGGSGGYAGRSGEQAGRSGEQVGRSGEYRPRSGEYRTRSGTHRVVRERRRGRRLVAVLLGVAAGAGACALAAFVVISGLGGHDRGTSGQVVGSTAQTPAAKAEKTAVPDACTLLDSKIADRLAPHAERGPADNYASNDRQNQCVWGVYSGEDQRQLSVEMRAIAGTQAQSPTDAARAAFVSERTADESGKALIGGQEITDKARVNGLGDEAYVVYSVDKDQGSGAAVANVRLANVLVTVHYSGSDGSDPIPTGAALTGTQDAARSVVEALNQS